MFDQLAESILAKQKAHAPFAGRGIAMKAALIPPGLQTYALEAHAGLLINSLWFSH